MDTASGREMKGNHFCLVVSPKPFKHRFQLAMMCPISGGISLIGRKAGSPVSLTGTGLQTDEVVLCHQLMLLDWNARKAKLIERPPFAIVQLVPDCISAVLEE